MPAVNTAEYAPLPQPVCPHCKAALSGHDRTVKMRAATGNGFHYGELRLLRSRSRWTSLTPCLTVRFNRYIQWSRNNLQCTACNGDLSSLGPPFITQYWY